MMQPLKGKTVFILGAGASFNTGIPLLKDFMYAARTLMHGPHPLTYKDAFEGVFKRIDSLRASAYYIDFDLDNLEHVFSLAELMRQIGDDDGKVLYDNLVYLILETIERTCILKVSNPFDADECYDKFVERIKEKNKSKNGKDIDSIITFNYDVNMEYTFIRKSIGVNYHFHKIGRSVHGEYTVLKLHGSVNWYKCDKCNSFIVIDIPLSDDEKIEIIKSHFCNPFVFSTMKRDGLSCGGCNSDKNLHPLIIPPTWSKIVNNRYLSQVWKQASEEITSARQIIIIGYSLPTTDTFLQYLLTYAFEKNTLLNRVIVVNPDNSDRFKDRYFNLFSKNFQNREKIIFMEMSFGEFSGQKKLWDSL